MRGTLTLLRTRVQNSNGLARSNALPSRFQPGFGEIEPALDRDLNVGAMPQPRPLVPEGDYTVITRSGRVLSIFKSRRLELECEIRVGEHAGKRLPWYCALPPVGRRPSQSSYFYRGYVLIRGRELTRGERASTALFVGKILRVHVVTVTTDHHKDPLPALARYSKISRLLERIA